MKKILILLIPVIILGIALSCSKDHDAPTFAKYEVTKNPPTNVRATYDVGTDAVNVEWEMNYPQPILDIIKGYYVVVSDSSDFNWGHVFHRSTTDTTHTIDNSYSLDAGFIPADVDLAMIYIKVSAVYENETLNSFIGPRSEPAVAVEIKK